MKGPVAPRLADPPRRKWPRIMVPGGISLFLVVPLLGFSPVVQAQSVPDLKVGDRVRVFSREGLPFTLRDSQAPLGPGPAVPELTGAVLFREGGSITLRSEASRSEWTIPIESVRRLEISRGRQRHFLEGMLVGAAAFGIGFGVACIDRCTNDLPPDVGPVSQFAVGAVWGLPFGAAVGLLAGAILIWEVWEEVPLPEASHVTPVKVRAPGRWSLSAGPILDVAGRVGAAITISRSKRRRF